MSPRRRLGIAVALVACLAAVGFVCVGPILPAAHAATAQSSAESTDGSTTTRLADGRWLVIAGAQPNQPTSSPRIVDMRDGSITPAGPLAQPRRGHTATLLPDGTVLISGGRSGNGQPATVSELFDPAVNAFLPIAMLGAEPHSSQTATLLT